jgi:hypothetical protein
VTNGQINKSFAQGVIYWLNYDVELDWAKYGVHCNKYVSKLKEMKATNVAREVETGKIRKVKRGLQLPNGKRVKRQCCSKFEQVGDKQQTIKVGNWP